jgi:hypothetical protein
MSLAYLALEETLTTIQQPAPSLFKLLIANFGPGASHKASLITQQQSLQARAHV